MKHVIKFALCTYLFKKFVTNFFIIRNLTPAEIKRIIFNLFLPFFLLLIHICFRVKGPHLKVKLGRSDGPVHLTWYAGPSEGMKIWGSLQRTGASKYTFNSQSYVLVRSPIRSWSEISGREEENILECRSYHLDFVISTIQTGWSSKRDEEGWQQIDVILKVPCVNNNPCLILPYVSIDIIVRNEYTFCLVGDAILP